MMKHAPMGTVTRNRPLGRASLGPLVALLLAAGCADTRGDDRSGSADARDGQGQVGVARSALGSASDCVSIRRQGASGAVFDAQIANKLPPRSYGASQTMNTGPIGSGNEERRSLVRFDLSAIPSLPHVTTNIESATVSLARGHLAATGPGTIHVHRVTAPWNESDVTWQSFGDAFDSAIEASFDNGGDTFVFGVEALVSGWTNGVFPNHGILLEDPGSAASNFWTSEHSDVASRPELSVCYSQICDAGFADCNGVAADGCETPLDTAADCGACGVACASGVCASGACAAPACDDGVANGSETGIDCGGSCAPCPSGEACLVDSDCQSASCQGGVCQASTGVVAVGGARMWADGAHGADCRSYVGAAQGAGYQGVPGDQASDNGLYWIMPPGAGAPFVIYCDMSYAGGGWTMMAHNGAGKYSPQHGFWTGVGGTQVPFTFRGAPLSSASLERVISRVPFSEMAIAWDESSAPSSFVVFSSSATSFAEKLTSHEGAVMDSGFSWASGPYWSPSYTGPWTHTEALFGATVACGDTCIYGLAVYSSWTGEPNGPCDHTTPDTGEGTCYKWWQVGAAGHRGGYATTTGYAVIR